MRFGLGYESAYGEVTLKIDGGDKARMFVLFLHASCFGEAFTIPVCPKTIGQQIESKGRQSARFPFGGLFDVRFRQNVFHAGNDFLSGIPCAKVSRLDKKAIVRMVIIPTGGHTISPTFKAEFPESSVHRPGHMVFREFFTRKV